MFRIARCVGRPCHTFQYAYHTRRLVHVGADVDRDRVDVGFRPVPLLADAFLGPALDAAKMPGSLRRSAHAL